MSSATKILLGIFSLIIVVLGVEAFVFFKPQLFPQTKRVPSPAPTSRSTRKALGRIDVAGKIVLVGYLNLFDITRAQVADWAKTQGSVSVPAYSGPLPTLPPSLPATISAQFNAAKRPDSVKVVAGNYQGSQMNAISLSQAGKEIKVTLSSGARLWIKSGQKLQIISTPLADLLGSARISQYININDLILAPNVSENSGQFKTSAIVVFR